MKKLLALLVVAAVACGKRGDPRPPVPVIPQATSDLVVTQRGGKVVLSWSYPSLTTAGRSLPGVRSVSVFRYVEDQPVAPAGRDPNTMLPGDTDPTVPRPIAEFARLPQVTQAQFARLGTRLDSIDKANLPAATAGAKLLYEDTPPFHTTDGRAVRVTYAVVTEGDTAHSDYSNLATIVPLDVPSAPANFTVTPKPEGVVLSWAAAPTPVIGYNIYRTAKDNAPDLFTAPINTAPVSGTTYTDTPPYGEHEYRVAAVASQGPPLIQSDTSAAMVTTFRDLVPPPPPTDVQALVETRIARVIWVASNAADLKGYHVYRIQGPHRLKLTVGPTPNTFFGDESVEVGQTYHYEITAVDTNGNESAAARSPDFLVPRTP
ncbi:MAG TPA: hypothetical protein VFN10_11720 [Thermoanaerobaculia bacterium]|nr:hypothetical protein [Thermoanaerobaculia bacterium]